MNQPELRPFDPDFDVVIHCECCDDSSFIVERWKVDPGPYLDHSQYSCGHCLAPGHLMEKYWRRWMKNVLGAAVEQRDPIPEWLPQEVRSRLGEVDGGQDREPHFEPPKPNLDLCFRQG